MQGLLISVVGTALGLVLGYALSWAGGHYQLHPSLRRKSTPSTICPLRRVVIDGVIVAAVSLGVSLLATLYPSRSAARVLPAEALQV